MYEHVLRSTNLLDSHVTNDLVDMYAKCCALLLADRMFDQIAKKELVSWFVMIAGYGMHEHGKGAMDPFKEMKGADLGGIGKVIKGI